MGALFVISGETTVTGYIGVENGGELARQSVGFHLALPPTLVE